MDESQWRAGQYLQREVLTGDEHLEIDKLRSKMRDSSNVLDINNLQKQLNELLKSRIVR